MSWRGRALAVGLAALAGCATVEADPERVPLCGLAANLQPLLAEGACDEPELGEYATALSQRLLRPISQALVRVEFDPSSRVRSVCVAEGVGSHAWHARLNLAPKLDAIFDRPPGPACLAGKRFDFNRYQSKYVEIQEALRWCDAVVAHRMEALRRCPKFPSDWILYNRIGFNWPYLYLRPEGSDPSVAPASDTLRRCDRTEWGFEAQSACILADGFQLLVSPEFEMLARPER